MLVSSNSERAARVSLYLTNVYLNDTNMDTAGMSVCPLDDLSVIRVR